MEKIIVCPKCFDAWKPGKTKVPPECKCFKCGTKYKPIVMYDYVYQALRRTHG